MKLNEPKYKTLFHKGPVFPPEYQPKGYTVKGRKLPPLAEEMLYCAARYLDSDYEKDLLSSKNFVSCFKPELTSELQKLNWPEDFMSTMKKMKADQTSEKELKKNISKEEKLSIKQEKEMFKKEHGTALIDGNPVEYMYMVEAPSIILTRGKDPRKFFWKYRVQPEDIKINSVNSKVPEAPKGHKWGKVVSDPTALNAFTYKMRVGPIGSKAGMYITKKANFSSNSDLKKDCVSNKYDKSSGVLKQWDKIQNKISADINSNDEKTRQLAIITYLIQMTGMRVGLEKNLDKFADTRGASSLCVENVTMWKE